MISYPTVYDTRIIILWRVVIVHSAIGQETLPVGLPERCGRVGQQLRYTGQFIRTVEDTKERRTS